MKALRRCIDLDLLLSDNLLEQDGFLAGSDAVRVEGLHRAFADPDAGAILCARGGYGLTRILGQLDPERLRHNPKLIVGFSDITALLFWAWERADLRSIHGPVLTQMSSLHPEDLDRVVDMMQGQVPTPLTAQEGMVVHGGTVEGPLLAGNLEVMRSLVGTRFLPSLHGTVLALEEVGEKPYRIDRALTQLISSGALRGVRGVVVGQLVGCDLPPEQALGPTAIEVVIERLQTLGIPVATGFDFGHEDTHNAALPFGSMVRLRADDCTLEFLEPVTR